MPYTPPLIRPLLPPLRPSSPFPYRPPVVNPPTQTNPKYVPPILPFPVDTDLLGEVCIYSNPSKWEPKKIRYKYPEESWKEIAGNNTYTIEATQGDFPLESGIFYRVFYDATNLSGVNLKAVLGDIWFGVFSQFTITRVPGYSYSDGYGIIVNYFRNGVRVGSPIEIGAFGTLFEIARADFNYNLNALIPGTFRILKVVRDGDNQEIPPSNQCVFKIFGVFGQEILSITRDVCPDVFMIPERCYYKSENEKLVEKVTLGFGQSLKIDYKDNCATVLLYTYPFPNPIQIYKECSDNPNCPPPKIRFDQKCEEKEKCEQCPQGTFVRVLIGLTIACVNNNGCVKKIIKYQPGCNTYDCVC